MAVDSAGYSTSTASTNPFAQSALFSKTAYDPAGSTLATGLQSAATFDPAAQSTNLPTSAVSFLGMTSGAAPQQQQAGPAQGYAAQPTSGLMSQAVAQNKSAFPSVSRAAAPYTASVATPGVSANATGANAAANTQAATNAQTQYAGPAMVTVRTEDGNFAYYSWDPATGGYKYQATYNKDGALYGGMVGGGSWGGGLMAPQTTLTPEQRASAQQVSLGAGQQIYSGQASASDNVINQALGQNISQWSTANSAAQANQAATATQQQTAANTQAILEYMTLHGGQAPQWATQSSGNDAMIQNALASAQATYSQQVANSAALSNVGNVAIDTSSTDATNQAAMNSMISQYASMGGGANAGLGGAGMGAAAGALSGQHVLSHQAAAAASYNTNLGAFSDALQVQSQHDTEKTGTQLSTDIQAIQDVASQLAQNVDQLGTTQRQQVQAMLTQLQAQIAEYQYAVGTYGVASKQTLDLAKGILSGGASLAAGAAGQMK